MSTKFEFQIHPDEIKEEAAFSSDLKVDEEALEHTFENFCGKKKKKNGKKGKLYNVKNVPTEEDFECKFNENEFEDLEEFDSETSPKKRGPYNKIYNEVNPPEELVKEVEERIKNFETHMLKLSPDSKGYQRLAHQILCEKARIEVMRFVLKILNSKYLLIIMF